MTKFVIAALLSTATLLIHQPTKVEAKEASFGISSLSMSCDSGAYELIAEQGDTVWCNVNCETDHPWILLENNGTRMNNFIMVYPFVNSTQWGAQANLKRSNYSGRLEATIAFPLPRRGANILQVALVYNLGTGPTVGLELSQLLSEEQVVYVQDQNLTSVTVIPRKNPEKDFLTRTNKTSRQPKNGGHTIMYWEPWYGPYHSNRWYSGYWYVAEAIPLVGQYASLNSSWWNDNSTFAERNRDVIRQHCIWWAMTGVTAIGIDWTNNAWEPQASWEARDVWAQQIYNMTLFSLQWMHQLHKMDEFPVPMFSIIIGLNNGANTFADVLAAEVDYLYKDYYSSSAVIDLSNMAMRKDDKPVLLVLDNFSQLASNITRNFTQTFPNNQSLGNFTLQFMGTQLQQRAHHRSREVQEHFVSWMDGTLKPVSVPFDNTSSHGAWNYLGMTITNGFFDETGWFGPRAQGTQNGATLLMEADWALAQKPQYLYICQWNEFKGNPPPYFPGESFADIWNATFTNDMEPTSLTTCSHVHRPNDTSCGGWGFTFLNNLRYMSSMRLNENEVESLQISIRYPSPAKPVKVGEAPFLVQSTLSGNCPGFAGVEYYLDGAFVEFQESNSSDLLFGAQLVNSISVSSLWIDPSHALAQHTLRAVAVKSLDTFPRTPCKSFAPNGQKTLNLDPGESSHEIHFFIV